LAHTRPVDPEAHETYLRGLYFNRRGSIEGWRRAIDFYEKAIEIDPNYAPPYAALAQLLAHLPYWTNEAPPKEFYPRARANVQTAIELDDTLARAHRALAYIAISHDYDWAVAEREYKRAIELEPGFDQAHVGYSYYLVCMGRSEEAIVEGIKSVELNPLSLPTNNQMGVTFYFARRYDEAIEQLEKVLDMEPNFWIAHNWLGQAYLCKERYEDALSACRRMNDLVGPTLFNPVNQVCHPYVHASWGKKEEAMRSIRGPEWMRLPPYYRAIVYGALGEKDEAFRLLEQAYEERSPLLAVSKVDPKLDPLRDDPRFQDFLRRMNFPE
jgi:serine/threonine-protein kinase